MVKQKQKKEFEMNDTLLRLSDLRQLGLEGGVMLYLQDGTVAKCRPKFAAIQKKERKNGRLVNVEEIVPFATIFQAISVVKRNNLVIARKFVQNNQSFLRLSGVGYHRKEKKRKERYETLNKAKFISLISTAVLATASSGVFADETTPVIDGSTSPTVSVTAPVPTDKSTDKAPDTSASHVSDGTSGVTAPVTPAPPTTPKSEEKPSTSETVTKTTASNSQIPDPNKVTDKAPEAKPSTEKQAAATETEALPHTGDDTALTVSLTSLGAFLIAAGLGFLPKRKKD